jgi:hypothetical protein
MAGVAGGGGLLSARAEYHRHLKNCSVLLKML